MNAHTEGPWEVSRSVLGELEPFGPNGEHLLSSEGPLPLSQRLANAVLIETAPALLAICEEIAADSRIDLMSVERRTRLGAVITQARGFASSDRNGERCDSA
jgi:hypothetical protein